MMPDRCQNAHSADLQMPPAAHASTPAIASHAGKRMVKCGKNVAGPGMKLITSRPTQERRMPRLEIRPSGRTPGGIFHLHERGAGWSGTGPEQKPFPKFPVGGPAPIFWPNFLGKNFGNKKRVVSIPEERVLRVVPF